MSERPKQAGERTPPVLRRVSAPGGGAGSTASPAGGEGPGAVPQFGNRGMESPEVTPAAAIAAGLPAEGNLADESPFHLYYLAAASQASGRLALSSELATYGLTFKKGGLEHASSTWPQDDLGEFLLRREIVRADQVNDARDLAQSLGGDILAAFVELRLIDPAARFQDLKEHQAGQVWRALSTEAGRWQWEPGVSPPPYGFPLGSRWGLLCEAVRRLDAAGVLRRLGERSEEVATRSGGRVDVVELKLNPQEARAAMLFDGQRTVAEIALAQPAEADLIRRVALLFAEAELLRFAKRSESKASPRPNAPPSASARVPAASPAAPAKKGPPQKSAPSNPPLPREASSAPPPPPAAKSATPPVAAAHTVESLRATLKRFQESDHFQVLGVPREADTGRIKTAYFQIAKSYHPDAAREGEPEEAKQLRAEVFARVGAAWAVLENETSRAAYLEELRSGGSSQVDVAAILKAEQIFEKVPALVAGRAYTDALARVNEAIELYSEEPEYAVWKGWIEFLRASDAQKKAQRMAAERLMEAALKESPKCAAAYLFLGRMAKLSGDGGAAERHFKRGLAEVPDHAELQRELRFLRK